MKPYLSFEPTSKQAKYIEAVAEAVTNIIEDDNDHREVALACVVSAVCVLVAAQSGDSLESGRIENLRIINQAMKRIDALIGGAS